MARSPDPDVATWREHWFPVAFLVDIEPSRLHRVTVFGEGIVLFRSRTDHDRVFALQDRCPHRAARLSDGQCRNGTIECGYHGWRFDSDGTCTAIPQLDPAVGIPDTAHATPVPVVVKQGMVWVHGGSQRDPDPDDIPTIDALSRPDCRSIDFAMDLPYGQDYLIENVLDFAHIHVAHDGVRGGGHRALAGPLVFDVCEPEPGGFSGRFGAKRNGQRETGEALDDARVEFVAPNLVHYVSLYKDRNRYSGLALYSVPLESDRCRLLYRAYSNFWPLRDRLRPRFWEHGFQCHLLEQDMSVVTGQAAELRRTTDVPRDLWLPLKTSDALVLHYRRWADRFAADRPDYLGFEGRSDTPTLTTAGETDRLTLHTRQCSSCTRALARFTLLRRWLPAVAFGMLAVAVVVDDFAWRVGMAVIALCITIGALGAASVCRRLTA